MAASRKTSEPPSVNTENDQVLILGCESQKMENKKCVCSCVCVRAGGGMRIMTFPELKRVDGRN